MRYLLLTAFTVVYLGGVGNVIRADNLPPLSSAVNQDKSIGSLALPGSPVDTGFNENVFSVGTYAGNLIVGGQFTTAAGISALKIVGWNGSSWFDLNYIPAGNTVYDLLEFNGKLYTGYSIARMNEWDGSSWTELMPRLVAGFSHPIWAVAAYDNKVIAGGAWVSDNGQPSYIAAWNGSGWDSLGTGIMGTVSELAVYDGQLIAGGYFTTADGSVSNRIAAWDGSSWSSLAGGMADGGVRAMTEYNGELIAAGDFTSAGGNDASMIAKWNGTNWQPLGEGLDDQITALVVHNGKLIAGGYFQNSDITPLPWVASWDGSTWSPVGTEMDGAIEALTVYNGYLIAGGRFNTAGAGKVALWDGSNWRPVGDIVADVGDDRTAGLPSAFTLDQNYPNPFNPTTAISYSLPQRSHVTIEIYNALGQRVRTLIDRQDPAGEYTVTWDGTNKAGNRVTSGVYLYRLLTGKSTDTKKMLLLK